MNLEEKIQAIMEGKGDLVVQPASATSNNVESPASTFDNSQVDLENPKQEVEDPTKGDSDEEPEEPVVTLDNPIGVDNTVDDLNNTEEESEEKKEVQTEGCKPESEDDLDESFTVRDGKVSAEAVMKLAKEMFPNAKPLSLEHIEKAKERILKAVKEDVDFEDLDMAESILDEENIAEAYSMNIDPETHHVTFTKDVDNSYLAARGVRAKLSASGHKLEPIVSDSEDKNQEFYSSKDGKRYKHVVNSDNHTVSLEESAEELLASDANLTEEYTAKAKELFAEEVATRVAAARVEIEEEFAAKLASILEQVDAEKKEFISSISEHIDSHLEQVSEQWVVDNKVAIETNIQVENADSLMTGLKSLFEQHNLILPEGGRDVLKELQEQVATLQEQVEEKSKQLDESSASIQAFKRSEILNEVCKGLTELDQSRLKTLVEDVEFVEEESFKEKVMSLKENVFSIRQNNKQEISESFIDNSSAPSKPRSPVMQAYLDALGAKKR